MDLNPLFVDTLTDIAVRSASHFIVHTLRGRHTRIVFFITDIRRRAFFIGGVRMAQAVFDVSVFTAEGWGITGFWNTFVILTDFIGETDDICFDPFSAHTDIYSREGFIALFNAVCALRIGTTLFVEAGITGKAGISAGTAVLIIRRDVRASSLCAADLIRGTVLIAEVFRQAETDIFDAARS